MAACVPHCGPPEWVLHKLAWVCTHCGEVMFTRQEGEQYAQEYTAKFTPWSNTDTKAREALEDHHARMGSHALDSARYALMNSFQPRKNTQQSSNRHDWETPREFYDLCNEDFGPFDLDAAASDENHLCEQYYTEKDRSLQRLWTGKVWCNPPYGKDLAGFVIKAYQMALQSVADVLMLFPPRSDTDWWHQYVMKATAVYAVKGRISFCIDGVPHTQNTFPSVLVWFRRGRVGKGTPDFGAYCQRCGLDCRCDAIQPTLL